MIPTSDLKKLARARIEDAEVLHAGKRYDGAFYLCGYAVELALKARICQTLKWAGFPETNKEFEGLQSFKVHRLDILLKLSGQEGKIKAKFLAEWSIILAWDPEIRYSTKSPVNPTDSQDMITSAKAIVGAL